MKNLPAKRGDSTPTLRCRPPLDYLPKVVFTFKKSFFSVYYKRQVLLIKDMHYILGLIMIVVGGLLVVKSEWFLQNFGTVAWAEEHLGFNGGSRLFYKLIGIVIIFFGFMVITNLMGAFLMGTVGKLFVR